MLNADTMEGFVGSVLQKRFDHPVATPECHREWWSFCTSSDPLVAIAAPRGFAKSTAITHSYVLAEVLFRQSKFVIIVSDTEAQAALFLGDIKNELIENEDLIHLFNIASFEKMNETDIIVKMKDGYKFRIMAKGAEQKLRGMKWDGLRPDLIVCDDLEGDEAVSSKDRRDKMKRWFYSALLPCRSVKGKVRIVGTILHMDSLLENLMPKDSAKATTVTSLRSDNLKTIRRSWTSLRYRAHSKDFKDLLWSEKMNEDALKDLRQQYTDQGLPDVYSREYLNYPIDESFAYFKREDLLPMVEEDFEKNKEYYAAIDFAVSTADRSDYTVIAVGGVDDRGLLHIVDIRRGRWDSLEIVDEMFTVQQRYQPELFITERGAIEKAIGPFLKQEMLKRGVYMNLDANTPTKDKMSRARSMQARLRAGSVRFDRDAEWFLTLEEEMTRFPKDKHDDQVDALSWIGLKLDVMVEPKTTEEEEEEEFMEYAKENYSGRSRACGY